MIITRLVRINICKPATFGGCGYVWETDYNIGPPTFCPKCEPYMNLNKEIFDNAKEIAPVVVQQQKKKKSVIEIIE